MTSLRRFRVLVVAGFLTVGLALLPSTAVAAPLQGTLNIANLPGGGVIVSLTTIDWVLPIGGGSGQFGVGIGSSGDFAGLIGTIGNAVDLNSAVHPVGTPFNQPGFLTFLVNPNIAFDLTFINPGQEGSADCAAPAAANQRCTPILPPGFGLSPFNLGNREVGGVLISEVSFALAGFVRNVLTGELSTFSGIYTTQFPVPYQAYLPIVLGGGSISNTYSGTFIAEIIPVPEPTTLLMLGAGFTLLAVRGRKGLRKKLGR